MRNKSSGKQSNNRSYADRFVGVVQPFAKNIKYEVFRLDPVVALLPEYPEISQRYEAMFPQNRMWLEEIVRRARAGVYTAALQAEVQAGLPLTEKDFAEKWGDAVNQMRADFELIRSNCVKFNVGPAGRSFVDAADALLVEANAACDSLARNGIELYRSISGATAGGKGKTAGARRGRDEDHSSAVHQQPAVAAAAAARGSSGGLKFVKSTMQPQPQAPPAVKEVVYTPEELVQQLRDKYKNHEQVSGPLALKFPVEMKQRMVEQHHSFAELCPCHGVPIPTMVRASTDASQQQQQQQQQHHKGDASTPVPPLATPHFRGYDPAHPPASDTIQSVLRDFFASVCARHATVDKEPKGKRCGQQDEAAALRVIDEVLSSAGSQMIPCPLLPFYFGGGGDDADADSKAPPPARKQQTSLFPYLAVSPLVPTAVRKVWDVITRVILPFYNEAAFKRFLYIDERKALCKLCVQQGLSSHEAAAEGDDSGAATPYWHMVMHFDVLIRGAPELPLVAGGILAESFKRASENTVNASVLPPGQKRNFLEEAKLIVGNSVVPVMDDLLQFIVESRLK